MYATGFKLLSDAPCWGLAELVEDHAPTRWLVGLQGRRRLADGVRGARLSPDGRRLLLWGEAGVAALAFPGLDEPERWQTVGFAVEDARAVADGVVAWGGASVAWLPASLDGARPLGMQPGPIRAVLPLSGGRIVVLCACPPDEPGARCLDLQSGAVLDALDHGWLGGVALEEGDAALLLGERTAVVARWAPGSAARLHRLPGDSLGAVRWHAEPGGRALVEGWEQQLWWVHAEAGLVAGPVAGGPVLGVDAGCRRAAVARRAWIEVLQDGASQCALPWLGPAPRVHLDDEWLVAALPMRAEQWSLRPPGEARGLQFPEPGRRVCLTTAGRVVTLDDHATLRLVPSPERWSLLSGRQLLERGPPSAAPAQTPPDGGDLGEGDAEVLSVWFSAPGLDADAVLAALDALGAGWEPSSTMEVDKVPVGLRLQNGWFCLRGGDPWLQRLFGAIARRLGKPLELVELRVHGGLHHEPPWEWGEQRLVRVLPDGEREPRDAPWAGPWVQRLDTDRVPPVDDAERLTRQLAGTARTRAWELLSEVRKTSGHYGAWSITPPPPLPDAAPPARVQPPRLALVRGDARLVISRALEEALLARLDEGGVLDRADPAPDLSRWTLRLQKRLGLDAPPSPDSAAWPDWRDRWLRLTEKERGRTLSEGRRIPAWKLTAPGEWLLSPAELLGLDARLALLAGEERDEARRWIAAEGAGGAGVAVLVEKVEKVPAIDT